MLQQKLCDTGNLSIGLGVLRILIVQTQILQLPFKNLRLLISHPELLKCYSLSVKKISFTKDGKTNGRSSTDLSNVNV